MNDRLEQFLAAENITQAAFADKIKVARASVSHILSGRNKPGYEFFAGLIRNYPALNIEWLISGKGKMYKENPSVPEIRSSVPYSPPLFPEDTPQDEDRPETLQPQKQPESAIREQVMTRIIEKQRKAVRIMVFYDDNTFEEFER